MPTSNKLQEWVQNGLINEQQAILIDEYESSKSKKPWVFVGFVVLGVIVVGLGVISMIAANWGNIAPQTKLITNFILLATIGFLTFLFWQQKKCFLTDVLLLGYMICSLAAIGLISQVYNLAGKLYEAGLCWSLITFAAVFISKVVFIPWLWGVIFFSSLFLAAIDSLIGQQLLGHFYTMAAVDVLLLAAIGLFSSKKFFAENNLTKALRLNTILAGLVALLLFEIMQIRYFSYYSSDYTAAISYSIGTLLFFLVLVTIWLNQSYSRIQKIILACLFLTFAIMACLSAIVIPDFVIALITITTLLLLAIFFASQHKKILFNMAIILLGIRFILLYFQSLSGLATTGIGLIFAGIIIISLAVLWFRFNKLLLTNIERLVNAE